MMKRMHRFIALSLLGSLHLEVLWSDKHATLSLANAARVAAGFAGYDGQEGVPWGRRRDSQGSEK